MITVKIFVYLKNTDLHCLSAFEAIKQLLHYEQLTRIRRYRYWEIDLPTDSLQAAQAQIETIIQSTYYLLNPNKEAYFLQILPAQNIKKEEKLFLVRVETPNTLNEEKILRRIKQKAGINLQAARHYLLWELLATTGTSNRNLQEELTSQVVATSSKNRGLLVNPVYEKAVFLDPVAYYAAS